MRYKLIPGKTGHKVWFEETQSRNADEEVRAIAQEFADRHEMPVLICREMPNRIVTMMELVHPTGAKVSEVRR